jgi:hypothetical protein
LKSTLLTILFVAACVAGIATTQSKLAAEVAQVKLRDDVYALPPPEAIVPMSLGYRHAGADVVWVKLLLEYGTHWSKRMYFREGALFGDDIIALDPKHRTFYQFIDTILIYQPTDTVHSTGTEEDCRAARRFLERSTQEFPYDGQMWLRYGQFVAFMAPGFIKDEREVDRWRVDGAKAITRAAELGVSVDRTMAAASLLNRAGETRAAVSHLERAYALTEDPAEREKIRVRLEALQQTVAVDEAARILKRVDTSWHRSMPFATRGAYLLMSPNPAMATCAGRDRATDLECLKSWAEVVDVLQGGVRVP